MEAVIHEMPPITTALVGDKDLSVSVGGEGPTYGSWSLAEQKDGSILIYQAIMEGLPQEHWSFCTGANYNCDPTGRIRIFTYAAKTDKDTEAITVFFDPVE